jgi:hypothetical protein
MALASSSPSDVFVGSSLYAHLPYMGVPDATSPLLTQTSHALFVQSIAVAMAVDLHATRPVAASGTSLATILDTGGPAASAAMLYASAGPLMTATSWDVTSESSATSDRTAYGPTAGAGYTTSAQVLGTDPDTGEYLTSDAGLLQAGMEVFLGRRYESDFAATLAAGLAFSLQVPVQFKSIFFTASTLSVAALCAVLVRVFQLQPSHASLRRVVFRSIFFGIFLLSCMHSVYYLQVQAVELIEACNASLAASFSFVVALASQEHFLGMLTFGGGVSAAKSFAAARNIMLTAYDDLIASVESSSASSNYFSSTLGLSGQTHVLADALADVDAIFTAAARLACSSTDANNGTTACSDALGDTACATWDFTTDALIGASSSAQRGAGTLDDPVFEHFPSPLELRALFSDEASTALSSSDADLSLPPDERLATARAAAHSAHVAFSFATTQGAASAAALITTRAGLRTLSAYRSIICVVAIVVSIILVVPVCVLTYRLIRALKSLLAYLRFALPSADAQPINELRCQRVAWKIITASFCVEVFIALVALTASVAAIQTARAQQAALFSSLSRAAATESLYSAVSFLSLQPASTSLPATIDLSLAELYRSALALLATQTGGATSANSAQSLTVLPALAASDCSHVAADKITTESFLCTTSSAFSAVQTSMGITKLALSRAQAYDLSALGPLTATSDFASSDIVAAADETLASVSTLFTVTAFANFKDAYSSIQETLSKPKGIMLTCHLVFSIGFLAAFCLSVLPVRRGCRSCLIVLSLNPLHLTAEHKDLYQRLCLLFPTLSVGILNGHTPVAY